MQFGQWRLTEKLDTDDFAVHKGFNCWSASGNPRLHRQPHGPSRIVSNHLCETGYQFLRLLSEIKPVEDVENRRSVHHVSVQMVNKFFVSPFRWSYQNNRDVVFSLT